MSTNSRETELILTSVVITTYQDDDRLKLTLKGFNSQVNCDPFEVIVVDDGGESKAKEIVAAAGYKYVYLSPPTPDFRLAAARNLGIWQTSSYSQRLIICDCDTVPNPNFVRQHQDVPGWTVAAGVRKRIAIPMVQELIASQDVSEANLEQKFYSVDERVSNRDYINLANNSQPWMYTWGCNFSMPTPVVKFIGGFDEEFVGWGGEDEDIANRLYRLGIPFCALPECVVYHLDHPPRTTQKAAQTFARKLGGPILRNSASLLQE
ncbi:MAG: glycosyltransferase [Hyphomicrobiaceae bacterium]|nr:MAG: glycosyltransferase [Hyphomicrobiaceae bacterium]